MLDRLAAALCNVFLERQKTKKYIELKDFQFGHGSAGIYRRRLCNCWRDFVDHVAKRIYQTGVSHVMFGGRFKSKSSVSNLNPVSHETHLQHVGFDSSHSNYYFYRK